MDVFIEKLITKRKTIQDSLVVSGIVFAALVASLLVFTFLARFLGSFVILLVAGIIYLAYMLIKSRNVEFEYAVTNGDLDIDKIMAQRKRKRIFSANCKDFDIVAKVNSDKYTPDVRNIQKRIEAQSIMNSPNVYFISLNYKGDRTVVYFEPDQRMLDAFKTFIPRKVFE